MTVNDAARGDLPGVVQARVAGPHSRAPSVAATLRRSVQRAWAWLVATYATVDPRSLGVCRILLGALLFADVARRYKDLDAYYTNLGWLANHFSLFKPMSSHVFSLYHAVDLEDQAHLNQNGVAVATT